MSGLTPLIDTLLHQVLGKRVDLPAARPLNPPVTPLLPSEVARAVHSDSRLDARLPQVLLDVAGRPASFPGQSAPPPAQASSATTTLSPAARTIADILLRHPAQPSAITPPAPLLTGKADVPADQLAGSLRQSISSSGVFYESHLARWYRGELPLQSLLREPQTWAAQLPQAAPTGERSLLAQLLAPKFFPASAAAPVAPVASVVQGGSGLVPRAGAEVSAPTAGAPPVVPVEAEGEAEVAGVRRSALSLAMEVLAGDDPEWSVPAQARDAAALKDLLQGVVRHQLELLVAPVLRWEGQVWPGVFMALLIQAPEDEGGGPRREGGAAEDEAAQWQVRFTLQLERLGELDVAVSWRGEKLSLRVVSESDELLACLEADRPQLQARLLACGFAEVDLQGVAARSVEGAADE